ncbi:TenA family protein [Thermodesulfobacteriota bacterium]
MTLSTDLWKASQDLALACLTHPFVQGLANGSLSRGRFAYYVSQDAFFLKAFGRAYSIAGSKAPDWSGFQQLHMLADGVLEELKLHSKYAGEWGVDVEDVKPAAATRRYTDFVLATAWGCDTGVTVVALSPCMRLYAYLGQQLAKQNPPEHQYIDWIRAYSSDDFENLARQLEELADTYASDTSLVRTTYRYAMECEHDFFQAAFDAIP